MHFHFRGPYRSGSVTETHRETRKSLVGRLLLSYRPLEERFAECDHELVGEWNSRQEAVCMAALQLAYAALASRETSMSGFEALRGC
jgi:hypothetical protein